MYTECPACKNHQTINVEQLRSSLGKVVCTHCKNEFNALDTLEKGTFIDIPATDHDTQAYQSPPTISQPGFIWTLGVLCSLLLLIFQIYYFEGYALSQKAELRPWLNKACLQLNCQLPAYKNLHEISILHGSFEPVDHQNYLFKTTFTNQSSFPQDHPAIKLTLLDFNGQVFAERVFYPQEYQNQSAINPINPEMTAEITMNIATPSHKIGGYRFELI